MKHQRYIQGNKKYWNELTPLHARSDFYNLKSFKKGKSTLLPLEIEEIGNVTNKTLLHLQCHFGMDTLSWARPGAKVTGVDLSDKSIELAKKLASDLHLSAKFVASDIYDLPKNLNGQFDIVYTLGGVLSWLPDLFSWAKIISQYVKNGGMFYLRDDHPFAMIFDEDMNLSRNYYHEDAPVINKPNGSYATAEKVTNLHYGWHHSLADIISALANAGLTIKFLHEFPFLGWARYPKLMQKEADGWYYFKNKKIKIPLMFSIVANK